MNGKIFSKNCPKNAPSKLATKGTRTRTGSLASRKASNIKTEKRGRKWRRGKEVGEDSFFLTPSRYLYFNNNANFCDWKSPPKTVESDDAESSMAREKKRSSSLTSFLKFNKMLPSRKKKAKKLETFIESDSEIAGEMSSDLPKQNRHFLTSTPFTSQDRERLSPVRARKQPSTPKPPSNFEVLLMTEEEQREQKNKYRKDLMNHYFGLKKVHGWNDSSSSSSSEDEQNITVVSPITERSESSSSSPRSPFSRLNFSKSRSRLTDGLRRVFRRRRLADD